MTTWDLETGDAFPARSLPSIPHLPSLPHLSDLPLPLPLPKPQKDTKQKDATRIPIFASEISLTYTPPTPLPHPFPRRLVLEGKSFYLASSVFIRHTLNTLYSDLGVTITKVAVSVPKTVSKSAEEAHPTPQPSASRNSGYTREKSFYIALRVTGKSRVSGTVGQWEVRSTYTFSPFDAKIIHHTVNGIEPAPEKGVFDALYRALRMPSLGRESQGALNYEKRGN
ncbi:hypothetical protein BDP27DRAFT_1323269 [Rhodocollybia butyracea]|uniref:Uncharacterized protein n=1 Tax=Rhodocollybia butyracea TaxID=206335 RepID=A0A9P5PYW4_9AGAR|nr:hypothetical protein BDP27DRAFT_1323269 [Rhodocollybia butyracea]